MNRKKCRKDYSPQNHPSKYITFRCTSLKLEWVQRHSITWSHRPVRGGHSKISGIVRQKVKEEIRDEIRREIAKLEDKSMPSIMKHFKANFAGKVDMSLVNSVLRSL